MERKDFLYLGAFALVLYLFGSWLMPVTDPVESNYVETAKEMMAAGDYLSPRIFGNYWYDKPILFYWELIAAFKIFGMTEFAARFFPAVFAVAGVLMTYGFGTKLYGRRTGLCAAVLLALSVEYWYLGHAIITDMTLWVTVSLTLMSFYCGYETGRGRYYYMAFAAAAVAVLTKGPIGLALPGLVILVFLAWQRCLGVLLNRHTVGGCLLFLVIVGVWYVPMYELHGSDFIDTFLGVHNALRATVAEHPRNSVWYYYLLVFVAGFFPWSLVAVPAFCKRLVRRELRWPQGEKERFLIAWALAVFIAFECMASKYMTYTFPYMMPLAILMGRYFAEHAKAFARMAAGMALVYFALLVAVLPVVMPMNSGKDTAAALKRMATPQTEVLTYGVRYPVSIAYYSGFMPKRLVATEADVEAARPQKMSWTATNVMPFAAVEAMDFARDTIIVTDFDNRGHLGEAVPGFWQEVAETDAYCIYRLVPGRSDGRADMDTGRTGAKLDVLRGYPHKLLMRWLGSSGRSGIK
ncbi:glycosyltransferase family 39 protein [Mitsuokella sp. UBA4253]|uniref:ArnT family glycosyltransferase n=1 Tax=Mitsuokella sp. UBA4253 TaxID=1946959 RepID=UPI00257D1FF0|nr:glycosyltransferase family 39 protein [Mitsuokella sp. UBA4253]